MPRFLLVYYFILSLVLSSAVRLAAQTQVTPATPWGSWLVGTVVLPAGDKKWGGFAEVQTRSNRVFQQFFYNELKGGVSYELNDNFSLTVAGGRYMTYDYQSLSDGPLSNEKRVWEQLVINQYLARIKFEHRYRIEQRWFTFRDGTDAYRSRIRYRLNMLIPLNNQTITERTFFLSVYDELFLNPAGPAFERNRAYAGVGYQFDKQWIVQLGWVNQINYEQATFAGGVFTPVLAIGKNNVLVGLTFRLKRRNDSERLPTQPD